ncbi:hypothetical protein HYT02_02635 [Candidatus Gottesmanbacteria bacterium]|nr:hypothetical protein [Candidatus Gottesmanbacteria bacterium]
MFSIILPQLFGTIEPPIGGYSADISGLTQLATNLIRLAILGAGIWAFFNFLVAGFSFLTASGDPKKVAAAWERIYLSVVGLVVIIASFILAAVVGFVVFGDPLFILRPQIYKPVVPTP